MDRSIRFKLTAKESPLTGSFRVYRALPRRELRRVGGFVFLDHFDAENLAPANFDVPPHPHIGLQTVTYLFEGEILHTDALGFQERITPGAVNWMTAGRGITHAEQVIERLPRMHGIQSWVGLPHDRRKTAPAFEHFSAEILPTVELDGAIIRVLAGRLGEAVSPIPTFQELTYLDVAARAGGRLEIDVAAGHELAVYVCAGEISIGGERVERFALAKLSDGADKLAFSCPADARFIVLGGEPLPDPTVIYWNFVTDTLGEAKQAMLDWEAGKFPPVPKYKKISGAPDDGDPNRTPVM
ncbi:MAG TPA: pirin family protein [Pyrinomonadaceae bacterium]|jgi:redox-sensitive bicupin YhaK (pirin superfamily)